MPDDLVEPTIEPAAEPDATPVAPAAEPEPIAVPDGGTTDPDLGTPDWLNDIGVPPEPAPQPDYWPRQDYPTGWSPPPQQAPQQVPQGVNEQAINAFVSDPEGFVSRIADQVARQTAGPIAWQTQQAAAMTNQFIRANADAAISKTKGLVDRGYQEVLNRDEAYRGNPAVKSQVDDALKGLAANAAEAARAGFPQAANMFENPAFFPTLLAAAKAMTGYRSGSASPVGAPQSAPVRSQAQPENAVELPPDIEAALDRLGPAEKEKARKEYARSLKEGDMEFWG